jgi:hypothetical protein
VKNKEGEEVIGPPLHHDWSVIYCKLDQSGNPRTMCYVHKRLVKFRPSYRREVIDHRDFLLLSLQVEGSEIFALNVYNDDRAIAVSFLKREGLVIPHLSIMESISFRDEPCNTLDSLWNALHSTYNMASGCECEMESLNEWPAFPEREWLDFISNEVCIALTVCAKSSAPGPDRITWSHLKLLLTDVETCVKVVDLANACFEHGHWPTFFKESLSVIIPKPGKLLYAAPKAFRPIVLLNTMGKLIEKCVSNHI